MSRSRTRTTHTYAVLPVAPAFYQDVRDRFVTEGYQTAIHRDGDAELIDMDGIALSADPTRGRRRYPFFPVFFFGVLAGYLVPALVGWLRSFA